MSEKFNRKAAFLAVTITIVLILASCAPTPEVVKEVVKETVVVEKEVEVEVTKVVEVEKVVEKEVLVTVIPVPEEPYMKMNPPADVDKDGVANPPIVNDLSCWMATAANMLAAAGYGIGGSLEVRAEDIYGDLVTWQTSASNPTGVADGGWADTALSWWLSSGNNIWTGNPYTVVTVYGNKSPKYPWANTNGARFIGNELRRCQFVGLSISWPTDAAGWIGSGGHAITAWGDHSGSATLTNNPSRVRVTDSDTDSGGDVQSYTYDAYSNPNPGGPNEGNGWYFDYDNNHPYIKHIITLCSTDEPSDENLTQKVVGSYKIHQAQKEWGATDLHYEVGTDVNILSYRTTVDWPTESAPKIIESKSRRQLTVDWDFSEKPVDYCEWVTITTLFILPRWNAIEYNDVHFTYPESIDAIPIPRLRWEMYTPILEEAAFIPDVTGGYVVGSFEITSPDAQEGVAEYRFVHEYSFDQDPEKHTFILAGEPGYWATNFRFGHSYGFLDPKSLWEFEEFEEWMTVIDEEVPLQAEEPIEFHLDWDGRLPYPEGEDITGRIPDIKQ